MDYSVTDLVAEVRVALDLNCVDTQLISDNDRDTLLIDRLIESKLPHAARIVETAAPAHLLDSGKAFGASIGWPADVGVGYGIIHLPDDFMRLVCFQMSDWCRPVTEAITEESPLYDLQRGSVASLRGNPENPVVAITKQPVGLVLEFYSCTQGSSVTLRRARYIPVPRIVSGGINLCEKLKGAVVHYCAHLVADATQHFEQSAALLKVSQSLMQ